jgi:hypothetical protein
MMDSPDVSKVPYNSASFTLFISYPMFKIFDASRGFFLLGPKTVNESGYDADGTFFFILMHSKILLLVWAVIPVIVYLNVLLTLILSSSKP